MPDGQTVRVKLGHHDRTWDLALLVPQPVSDTVGIGLLAAVLLWQWLGPRPKAAGP